MSVSLSTPSTAMSCGTLTLFEDSSLSKSFARSSYAAKTAAGRFSFSASDGSKSSSHQIPLSLSAFLYDLNLARSQSCIPSEWRNAYDRATPCPMKYCAAALPIFSPELRIVTKFLSRRSSGAERMSITIVGVETSTSGTTDSSVSGMETIKPSVPPATAFSTSSRVSSACVRTSVISQGESSG